MRKVTKFVCGLLCFAIAAGCVNRLLSKENKVDPTRTLHIEENSFDSSALLKDFRIIEEKNFGSFYCVKAEKDYMKSDFFELDFCEYGEDETITAEYNVGYDHFHEKLILEIPEENFQQIGLEINLGLLIGDVFKDDNGNINAVFSDEDGTFYLSDFDDLSSIENCSLITKVLKTALGVICAAALVALAVFCAEVSALVVAVIGISIFVAGVVLSEIEKSERSVAKDNYENNVKLQYPVNALKSGNDDKRLYGYICDQNNSKFKKFKVGSKYTIDYAGCEIIACYNALKMLGKERDFSAVIYDIECLDILFKRDGEYGSNPYDLGQYFKSNGAKYSYTTSYATYKRWTTKDEVISVVSYAHEDFFDKGLHTFVISKLGGKIYAFNRESNVSYTMIETVDDIGKTYGGFLCSYVFKDGWSC